MADSSSINVPKKRGRKPKNASITNENPTENVVITNDPSDLDKNVPKKRGRKPKGGKIVVPVITTENESSNKVNVILHLKCSLKELQQPMFNENLDPFNSHLGTGFENTIEPQPTNFNNMNNYVVNNYNDSNQNNYINTTNNENTAKDTTDEDVTIKEINRKLKQLEHQLHYNHTADQNSACFWCTYSFDNQPIYIPKFLLKDTYHVYGCFCSPECATAHLMQENIDSSIKFERYYLLNNIYGGIYNYTKNIKPAPSPYYMLDKYYGNMSIQEYRALLSNERLFLIVDKPLTKVMPELHQTNEDHIISNKIIPTNQGMKKNIKKNITKNDILAENFGFNVQQS